MSLFKRDVQKIYCQRIDTPRAKIPTDKMCEGKSAYGKHAARKKSKFWGQRAYKCPVCFKWHMTKRSRK